jgi:hypothetical protein
VLLSLLLIPLRGRPYSLLTHEQIIDLAWKESIVPLLLEKYPGLTDAQLREAHAYAYGGCVIQDIGYYPFGNSFFSDLTHYVRTGDFVASLLRNAHTADELAFAIGALSHYVGDTIAHGDVVNLSVGIEFPELAMKHGPVVYYAEGKSQHVRTEFAFDVDQLTKHRVPPSAYLSHIGLNISKELIKKAFWETYGLNSTELLGRKEIALRSYRRSTRWFIPRIADGVAVLHKKSFPDDPQSPDIVRLQAEVAKASLENGWEPYRGHPGVGTHLFAGFIFIVPKFGPLSMVSIRGPQPLTELLFIQSINHSVDSLKDLLANYYTIPANVPNRDLDTGAKVRPGYYPLTDQTHAELVAKLTRTPQQPIPYSLKREILDYYSDPTAPISTKNNPQRWALLQDQLKILAAMPTSEDPPAFLSKDNKNDEGQKPAGN